MSRSSSPTVSHRLEYLVYRVLEWMLCRLSLETTFKLGEFAGRLVHLIFPGPRATVIRNLRFAYGGEKSLPELEQLAARVFERTAANMFSSIRLPFLSDETIARHVVVEGLSEVLKTRGKQGIVAVSPHMGNWELLAQTAYMAGDAFPVGTHYRPLNNQLLNALVERRRKRRGLKLFAKRSSGHAMASFVKKGGLLAILADQRVGSRGFPGVFFGRPTTCSALPDLMARRGEARLIRLACETIGMAQWKISLTPIDEISPQACASSLEEAWRRSPEDVFWFEDRWRLRGGRRLSFLHEYDENHGVTRPLRFVNLVSPDQTLAIPEALATQEYRELDFRKPDSCLRHELSQISREGDSPVDLFLCPTEQLKRVSRLSEKILVLPPDSD